MTDDPTIARLGLRQPTPGAGMEHLGTVDFPNNGWVEVSCMSAVLRYWQFQVYCADNDRVVRVETGEGPLEMYWPTVELLADGMIGVIVEVDSLKAEVEAAMNEPPLPPERQLSLYRRMARMFRGVEGGESMRRESLRLALQARDQLRHPAE